MPVHSQFCSLDNPQLIQKLNRMDGFKQELFPKPWSDVNKMNACLLRGLYTVVFLVTS